MPQFKQYFNRYKIHKERTCHHIPRQLCLLAVDCRQPPSSWMSHNRTGSSISISGVVPIKSSRLEATLRCAVSIPIPLVVQLPTTVVVPILVISEIPWSKALLVIMLLSWMFMLCKALILSVSQLATIFALH